MAVVMTAGRYIIRRVGVYLLVQNAVEVCPIQAI